MHTQVTPSTGRLDTLWANLTAADKHVILGHSRLELTPAERLKFAKVVTALGAQARQQPDRSSRSGRSQRPVRG